MRLVRVILIIVALAAPSVAGATMVRFLGGSGGAGVVAKSCTAGDFFTSVDASGNFTCSTPSAGSGDVTSVGDCTSGACFDGTQGNSLQFEGSTADGLETTFTATDPTADRTITLPNRTGTVALEKVVNLYDYAACDGTDEFTAIQAAITAACALGPGGTLYVPADTCVFGSTLTLCSGLAIIGSDSTERVGYGTAQPHELSYSGTGTAIDAQSLSGVRLSGLLLRATSASFAGPMVDADSTGYLYIERVMMTAASQAGAATCAHLSINDGTDITVDGSAFYRCGYAIKGRVLSSNYANVVRLNHNAFYQAEACSVLNPGDAWEVTNNKWQQQGATDNESDMFCHGAGICTEGMTFTGNMSVDQPASPTNAEFIFCGSGFNISGNYFGGGGTQDGVLFDEQCDGCSVQGNWFGFFDEAVKFSGTGSSASDGVVIIGNDYDTVTTKVGGTRPGGSIMQENTGGTAINEDLDIWLNVDTDANSSAGAVVIGSNATSTSATPQYYFLEASRAEFRRGNDLRLYETDDSNYVQVSVPTLAADYTLTLPTTDGNANEFLQTNGSGTTTWAAQTSYASTLLDGSVHTDTAAGSVARGDLVTGQSVTPKWTRLAKGAATTFLKSDGTDLGWDAIDLGTDTTGSYAAGDAEAGKALYINATSCSYVGTASDGTPSCVAAPSTPEYVSRTMAAGGTLGNYAVVAANGSTGDSVIEAATTVTQILGCSQDGNGAVSTDPVEIAVGGIARCKADTTVAAGSLVKLGASGEFSLATTADKTWGRAVTDDDGAGSAYILLFDGAEGTIDHKLDLWTSVPDLTTNTINAVEFSPTVNTTGAGSLVGFAITPTQTLTGTSANRAMLYSPTVALNGGGDLSSFYIIGTGGTITSSPTTASLGPVGVLAADQMTFTATGAGKSPLFQGWGLLAAPTISSSATSSTATTDLYTAADYNPTFNQTGNGGALSITNSIGYRARGTLTAGTGGTATIVTRQGFLASDFTTSGAGTKALTTNVGFDAARQTASATSNVGFRGYGLQLQKVDNSSTCTACTDANISWNDSSFIRLTGNSAKVVSGIGGGADGRILYLYNQGSGSLTIDDDDSAAAEDTPASQILTMSGADKVCTGVCVVTMIYDSDASRWVVTAVSD